MKIKVEIMIYPSKNSINILAIVEINSAPPNTIFGFHTYHTYRTKKMSLNCNMRVQILRSKEKAPIPFP